MMLVSTRNLLVFTLSMSILTPAKPLSETMATGLSVAGGAVVGLGVGVGTYYVTNQSDLSEPIKWIVTGIAGVSSGGLSWYLLNQWLYSKTPTARIAAAALLVLGAVREVQAIERDLSDASVDKVVSKNFATDTDFIANVNARFGTCA